MMGSSSKEDLLVLLSRERHFDNVQKQRYHLKKKINSSPVSSKCQMTTKSPPSSENDAHKTDEIQSTLIDHPHSAKSYHLTNEFQSAKDKTLNISTLHPPDVESTLNLSQNIDRKTHSVQNSPEAAYDPHCVRDLAAEWMLEVVNDSGVKMDVFLLSVQLMDSFLDICPIRTNQVQLLASACLLLAAKVRLQKTSPEGARKSSTDDTKLNEHKIVDYTDNSITMTELQVRKL